MRHGRAEAVSDETSGCDGAALSGPSQPGVTYHGRMGLAGSERIHSMQLVIGALARLVGGWLALCGLMTLIAIGMKLFGDLAWPTLGIWLLIDVGLLALRWGLLWLGRRLQPGGRPKPS